MNYIGCGWPRSVWPRPASAPALPAALAACAAALARPLARPRLRAGPPGPRSPARRFAAVSAAPVGAADGRARLPDTFRFCAGDSDAWLPWLREHGVVVLEGALSSVEVERAQELMWAWLEKENPGVRRGDPATWTMEDGRWPADNSSTGITCVRGAGQSAAAWTVRASAAVQGAFETIWGTASLLSSMDGLILWRPWGEKPSEVREEWRTRGGWLHMDQNLVKRPDLEAVQGLVALSEADPAATGGFVCIPGSHVPEAGEELVDRLGGRGRLRKRGDFLALEPGDPWEPRAVGVCLRPGDLVLWDSRLVHASEPAPEGAVGAGSAGGAGAGLLRMAVPVCMVPRASAGTAEEQAALASWRADAVRRGATTKHWPHKQRVQGEAAGSHNQNLPSQGCKTWKERGSK